MKLSSTAFQNNAIIPARYTCDGVNVNPPLTISDVPAGTQSLALIVHDPDAPRGDWTHWLVWGIDSTTTTIAEDSVPAGAIQGVTDFGSAAWGGPCPPSGTHRYVFKLYALDAKLELSARQGHILEEAELVGNYQRS